MKKSQEMRDKLSFEVKTVDTEKNNELIKENYVQHLNQSYQRFRADLKIAQMRAMNNKENESAKYYKDLFNKMELIRERRHLALIGEQSSEKIMYRKILQEIGKIYIEHDNVYNNEEEMFKKATKKIEKILNNEYNFDITTKRNPKEDMER